MIRTYACPTLGVDVLSVGEALARAGLNDAAVAFRAGTSPCPHEAMVDSDLHEARFQHPGRSRLGSQAQQRV